MFIINILSLPLSKNKSINILGSRILPLFAINYLVTCNPAYNGFCME